MDEYAVAIRRSRRSDVPSDWVAIVRAIDGVNVVNEAGDLLLVRATTRAVSQLRATLGRYLHVEPIVAFEVLGV